MTKEEKKAIERLTIIASTSKAGYENYPNCICMKKDLILVLNLIQSQQKEIEKLKDKNKDLLRKLRNRVKEVKKLTKYSLYKKEFSRLNKEIEKKETLINTMQEEFERLENLEDNTDMLKIELIDLKSKYEQNLSMCKHLRDENNKKDKIINEILQDLMICGGLDFIDIGKSNGSFQEDKRKLKQYFEKKVEGK